MKLNHLVVFNIFFIFLIPIASALEIGSVITPFSLNDQHDKVGAVNKATSYILFVRDRKANKIITEALKNISAEYLTDKNIIYVADISRMPSFVSSWFAIPKMKKYSYRILLDREPKLSKQFSSEKDKVSLFYLNNLSVTKVEYFSDPIKTKQTLDGLTKK